MCRAYCAAHGWDVADVVTDLDVSGSDKGLRLNRPGLLKVRARWGEADVLVFAKLDRIARNVGDWTALREEADRHGVALVSVAENLDLTTPSGRFVATILQAFAEMEAAMISTRTKEAVAYLAREGRHRGGLAAFGWRGVLRTDGPGYRLALDPERAPIVREAVDRITAGEPISAVVEDFNARGLASPEGNGWKAVALRRLLGRPILRGLQVHRGQIVRGADGLAIRPHEALLSDAEARALEAALARRSLSMTRSEAPEFTLARTLVSCAECGARLYAVSQDGKPAVWSCSSRRSVAGGGKCPGVVISRKLLEEHLVERVLERVGDLEGIEVTQEERADDEIAEVEEALDLLSARFRETDNDEEAENLMGQRKALRARLRDLAAQPVILEASERPTGRTFRQVWAEADEAGRSALLASVLAFVVVSKGTRGRRGLDASRLGLVWQPSPTAASGTIEPGVVYRPAA